MSSHEILYSILSINYLLLDFICLLWRVKGLSHYGEVICLVHITSLENVNIWGMSLRIDIGNYLVSLWHAKLNHLPSCINSNCYLIACTKYYLLEWDKHMSICAMFILMLICFCLVHMLYFVCGLVWICHFDIIWTTRMILLDFMAYVFFCPNYTSLDLGRPMHEFLIIYSYPHALLALFDPLYRINSIKSLLAKMCIKFKSISICTYLIWSLTYVL